MAVNQFLFMYLPYCCLALLVILTYRFPTLNRWIQMQTNLHRVSEFAVTIKQTADGGEARAEARAIKRLRDLDSDTESEADDIVGSSSVSTALPDLNDQGGAATEPWDDSSKSDVAELDTSVFLSFDWENEEPYEKAVQRYYSSLQR